MPRRSMTVQVKPSVFRWLRESAGWTVEDVSKRLNTSIDTVKGFESGEKEPTLRQLKELSQAFKRPLAAFLLPKEKEERPLPKDYRMIPNREGVLDKKTIVVLRKARSLQDISLELSRNIEYPTKPKIKKVKISEDPTVIAKEYRDLFKLTEEKQKSFKTTYEFFNYLRDVLEDMNILVFQFSMPVEDARGFVLADEYPYVIVVSTKDSIEARLFSLMHEFAHILLGESVIDLPDANITIKNDVEAWCNKFASSVLFPVDTAKELFESKKELTSTKALKSFSKQYKVSKAVILVSMLRLGCITKTDYQNVLERYRPKEARVRKKAEKKSKGGIPSDKRCLSRVGVKFVSLVANNYDRNQITYNDALNYLSVKSRNFDKVLAKARK